MALNQLDYLPDSSKRQKMFYNLHQTNYFSLPAKLTQSNSAGNTNQSLPNIPAPHGQSQTKVILCGVRIRIVAPKKAARYLILEIHLWIRLVL